jgi:hypothetical protein
VPRRGGLQSIHLSAAISCEIKGIGELQILAAGYCDEIVNSALLEIATGQSLCLQGLEADDENDGLQSMAYGGYEPASAVMNLTTSKVEKCNGENAQFSEDIFDLQIPRFARDDNNSIQTLFPRILRLQFDIRGDIGGIRSGS